MTMTAPHRRERASRATRRVLRLALLALATLLGLAAALHLGPAAPARAAAYGPGYDDADNGGVGRIGAYAVEGGRLVYCLEPAKARPLGETTSAGTSDGSRLSISPADTQRLNWAISTYGQTADPDVAAAVAMFVWSTAAFIPYMSHGMHGDDWYIGRVPAEHRATVFRVLNEMRAGADAVGQARFSNGGELALSIDEADEMRGAVSLDIADTGASALVRLEHAVFEATGTAEMRVARGADAPFRATSDAMRAGPFRVRASAEVELPDASWSASIAVYETPGAQLLGGAGGRDTVRYRLTAEDARDRVATFSPIVATSVASAVARPGEPLVDSWRVDRATTAPWLPRSDGRYAVVRATATLYGPFGEAPREQSAPPSGAPIAAIVDVTLGGGASDPSGSTVTVSTADARTVPGELPSGWYTWVAEIRADGQPSGEPPVLPAGYAWRDAFGVGAETALVGPRVTTAADAAGAVGGAIRDTAILDGVVPEGATLEFAAYRRDAAGGAPSCATPIATTDPVPAPAGRQAGARVASPPVVVDAPGEVLWIETLRGADGAVLHAGECGAPGESTRVELPPTPAPTPPAETPAPTAIPSAPAPPATATELATTGVDATPLIIGGGASGLGLLAIGAIASLRARRLRR